jgi:hypothetical protein
MISHDQVFRLPGLLNMTFYMFQLPKATLTGLFIPVEHLGLLQHTSWNGDQALARINAELCLIISG